MNFEPHQWKFDYHCIICYKSFVTEYCRKVHLNEHPVAITLCDRCDTFFEDRSEYKQHVQLHVLNETQNGTRPIFVQNTEEYVRKEIVKKIIDSVF